MEPSGKDMPQRRVAMKTQTLGLGSGPYRTTQSHVFGASCLIVITARTSLGDWRANRFISVKCLEGCLALSTIVVMLIVVKHRM